LYITPDIIREIESRRMKWVGHVARMGETINTIFLLEDLGVDEKIILEWILGK
jgi:hypothetical protein